MRRCLSVLLAAAGVVSLPAANIPRPSPELVIPLAGGRTIQLSQYRGKVVALEFLLTTCPHCQRASQSLNRLYQELGPKGFQPLGVALDDKAPLGEYVQRFGLSYPVGAGTRNAALKYLQHPAVVSMMMPQLVFIDREGVIRAQYPGTDKFFDNEEQNMRAKLLELLGPSKTKKNPGAKPAARKTAP